MDGGSIAVRWAASWLLDFAQTDLHHVRVGREALKMAVEYFPRGAYEVVEFRRHGPLRYRTMTTNARRGQRQPPFGLPMSTPSWQLVLQVHLELKSAINSLRHRKTWRIPATEFRLEPFEPPSHKGMPRFLVKRYNGPLHDIFLAVAADVLASMWSLIRQCGNNQCNTLFLPEGKRRYCSDQCRNKANWGRYLARHTTRKRDYRGEYGKRKAKQLGRPLKRTAEGKIQTVGRRW